MNLGMQTSSEQPRSAGNAYVRIAQNLQVAHQ
jgi:hypothetical protein